MATRIMARALACALLGAWSAHAQLSPRLSAAETEEPPAQMPPLVVTGTPLGSELFEFASPTTVLRGGDLRLKQRGTVGETLAGETGVSSTYFGPNASRPVIRGLDGDRVRLLQNGVGMLDASAASFDHAVSADPMLADRIEVVRGPAARGFGGHAGGGVVNLIDNRIAQFAPSQPIAGAATLRYDTARRERAGAGRVEVGNQRLALHADAFARDADDLRIPGAQRSRQLRRLDPLPPGEHEPRGRLTNSASTAHGGAVGASLLFGEQGYTGASFQEQDNSYGTVAETDVTIRMRQQRWDFAGELRPERPFLRAVKYKFGHSDYRHEEREGGETGTVFRSRGYDGRVELMHGRPGALEGAFGLQRGRFEFEALGDEAFLPRTRTRSDALFVYETLPLEVAPRAKLSFGARLERTDVHADAFDAAGGVADSRRFTTRSAAAGLFAPITGSLGVASNLAYTERAPTYQELYADGPHLATDAFELGDRGLGKEKSTAIDLALRRRGTGWRGSVGVFYSRFEDYVALLPSVNATGAPLFRDAEDRGLPATADPGAAGYAEPILQHAYAAIPATFRGFEAEITWPLWRRAGGVVELELRSDYTRASDRDSGEPLPRIPAWRYGGGLRYAAAWLHASLDVMHARRQGRLPDGALPADGYTLVSASLSYRLRQAGIDWEAFARADNLLNEDARPATSFLKDRAPLAARGLSVGLRGAF